VEDEPSAFLETVDEIKAISGTPFQRYIANGWIAGAFMGDTLVGISGLYRHKGEKLRHKGTVWGVYVVPPARERGLARRMIALLLDEARQAGLELVHISTDSANRVTMGLYQSLGFTPWGTDRRMIKLPERYVDDVMMVMSLI
jgi:RimJ/RimL family protein N-acetyltransferase